MRLGVLMLGRGAHAAACVGVMEELQRRQALPFAVCGLHAGAWPAALVMAGRDAAGLREALVQAARLGPRLLRPDVRAGVMLRGGRQALCTGVCLQRLLSMQAGERVLAMCCSGFNTSISESQTISAAVTSPFSDFEMLTIFVASGSFE